ncbi:CPBP family intramembrane glutamic endopeptidase [Haloplanus natans]|uniref:CPBP family intramembrane glutamic endopeptidase n=1 Tax=Haloplanus natans TaxID=376171 RepID=UPI0006777F0B|nr:CPBP family intramembrane glutamic endopeptidase [Haloplanus natans]
MSEWTAFAGFVGVVLVGLLLLARASATALTPSEPPVPETPTATEYPATLDARVVDDGRSSPPNLSTATLLLNVVVSQGLFASLLLVGMWVASIPPASLGLGADSLALYPLAVGVGLGVTLHGANTVGSRLSDRFGFGDATALREAMAPDSVPGWAALLLVVLPLVAGFEELLFRGVLIGAFATGFDLSPWLLAAFSSVAFALGHGAQGRAGVVVTGTLGFVLAAAFVLTGSLAAVIVAHYLVNALEFVVHER